MGRALVVEIKIADLLVKVAHSPLSTLITGRTTTTESLVTPAAPAAVQI